AAIVQGAIFGLLHSFGYVHAVGAGLIGFALALLYEWRRTLLAPIFVHALNNLAVGLIAVAVAISAANAPALGIQGEPVEGGCQITAVFPGSGAEEAGLRIGDVVTAIDGVSVADIQQVAAVLRRKRVGEQVMVEFIRAGEMHRG